MLSCLVFVLGYVMVSSASTIRWTNGGGNSLWFNPRNWDCNCLPTSLDDVVVDMPGSNVAIRGPEALCRTISIGQTSQTYLTTVSVYSPLTLTGRRGNSFLYSSGRLVVALDGIENALTNYGNFSAGGRLEFASGSIAGIGSFTFDSHSVINFTGSAEKFIFTSIQTDGKMVTSNVPGGVMSITLQGNAIISGNANFYGSDYVIINLNDQGTMAVNYFYFKGMGLDINTNGKNNWQTLIYPLRIYNNWILAGPSSSTPLIVTVYTSVSGYDISLTNTQLVFSGPAGDGFGSGFNNITGNGSVKINDGGISIRFMDLPRFEITGGFTTVEGHWSVDQAILRGGTIGAQWIGATITASIVQFYCPAGLFGGVVLQSKHVELLRDVVIRDIYLQGDGTTLRILPGGTLTVVPIIGGSSILIYMIGGSWLEFGLGAKLIQNEELLIWGEPAEFIPVVSGIDTWTSTKDLTLNNVVVKGSTFLASAPWKLNNCNLTASSITTSSTVEVTNGTMNVDFFSGDLEASLFALNPISFTANHFQGKAIAIKGGNHYYGKLTSASLEVQNGTLVFGGNESTVGNFTFTGGVIMGRENSSPRSSVQATLATVSGCGPQTLENVNVFGKTTKVDCDEEDLCVCTFLRKQAKFASL